MQAPDGIPGSVLTGPYPVGTYAAALRHPPCLTAIAFETCVTNVSPGGTLVTHPA